MEQYIIILERDESVKQWLAYDSKNVVQASYGDTPEEALAHLGKTIAQK